MVLKGKPSAFSSARPSSSVFAVVTTVMSMPRTRSMRSMFHEIDQDRIDRVRGMDITVVTTAKTDDEGRALLKALGFPFKTN